ncbi:MAG: ABC transporter permease [Methanosarcinales archaeon]
MIKDIIISLHIAKYEIKDYIGSPGQILGNTILIFILVTQFGFIGKSLLGNFSTESIELHKKNYMIYTMIGIVLWLYFTALLGSISGFISEKLTRGELESFFFTPINSSILYFGIIFMNSLFAVIQLGLIVSIGLFLIGYEINLGVSKIIILFFTIVITTLSFIGFSLVIASITILLKNAQGIVNLIRITTMLVCGVFYPITVYPEIVQRFLEMIPLTLANILTRELMMKDNIGSIETLFPKLSALMVLSVLYLILGIILNNVIERIAKKSGTLTQC